MQTDYERSVITAFSPPHEQWHALESERDRLRLLLEVSESIASHRDVAALLHDLAQRLPRIVPFDVINIVLHDPVRNSMRLHAVVAPEFNKTRPGLEFSMDETTSKFVWENQQPVMVEDVEAERGFPRLMAVLRENGVRSYCTVPLTTPLRRLGDMSFASTQKRTFIESEIAFLQQVARQIAIAVDNVLHEESARQAQEQLARERDRVRLLLEVNNAVVSHLDLDKLFPAVSACVRRVVQHGGGDEPRPGANGRGRNIPQRPVLSPECVSGFAAAVARAPRGYSDAGQAFHAAIRETDEPAYRNHPSRSYGCVGSISVAWKRPRNAKRHRTRGDSVAERPSAR
jgi:hypothetical protein